MTRQKKFKKGYVQVYTGNGKGKTTAAFGLAVRAVGAGKRVFIAQFAKGMKYSELSSLRVFHPRLTMRQYGLRCFIRGTPKLPDIEAARKGLKEAGEIIAGGKHDLVILDEANIATYYSLFTAQELLAVLKKKPAQVEVVITGRYADKRIMEFADLVTEMREVKHYFHAGVKARPGIEC